MRKRHFQWGMFAVLAATAGVLLAPGVSMADTRISSSGKVGAHHLDDTFAHPGVRCHYQDGAGGGDEDIDHLTVMPPVLYAVDKTGARDKQLVGWRAVIQRRDPGGSFVTVQLGGIHKAWAWDDTAAALYARDYPETPRYPSDFRVRILMFWYASNGTVTGTALSEVDWYKKIYRSSDFGDDIATLHNFCRDYFPG